MLVSFRRAEKFIYSVIIFYKRELLKLLSYALNREKYNRIKTNLNNAKNISSHFITNTQPKKPILGNLNFTIAFIEEM